MIRSFLLTAALLASALPHSAHAAQLVLRGEALAFESIVRVRDVAEVTGDTLAEIERIGALPLMPAPAPGEPRRLSARVLRDLLAAQGERIDSDQFFGAKSTTVTSRPLASEPPAAAWRPSAEAGPLAEAPPAPSVARQGRTGFVISRGAVPSFVAPLQAPRTLRAAETREVKKRVTNAISRLLEQSAEAPPLAVRSVRLTETTTRELLALGAQPLTAHQRGGAPPVAGESEFLVWGGSNESGETFRVVADLVEPRRRVVAVDPIGRGTLVTASSVRLEPEPLDAPPERSAPYRSLEEVIGKEATRSVRPGQPLTADNTASPMLVRRGETVAVSSGGAGIHVRLTAVARGDGRLGDLVTVEAYDRSERFDARVVGPRRLAILGAGGAVSELAAIASEGARR